MHRATGHDGRQLAVKVTWCSLFLLVVDIECKYVSRTGTRGAHHAVEVTFLIQCITLLQVQHAGLKDSCTADILTVECLVRLVDWFFPDFNYTWLVEEIKNTTPKVCVYTMCCSVRNAAMLFSPSDDLPHTLIFL